MSRAISLTELAKEAEAELDDVLVTLWDAGFDELESPSDLIPFNQIDKARSALQIDPPRTQTRVKYWLNKLDIDHDKFNEILLELGIKGLSKNARVLPKGALRKLRRKYILTAPESTSDTTTQKTKEVKPCPPFEWDLVGQPCQIKYLSEDDITSVHDALVRDFESYKDPISPPGIRDDNLLSSAIMRSQTGFGNQQKYPTIEMAGAALLHSLVLNHAFCNGNKRTGLVSLLVFLDTNLLMPTCSESELFKLTLNVAQHGLVPLHWDNLADREVLKIADWINRNSRKIQKGDRPLDWLKLKRILKSFDCKFTYANVGNRIDISRIVERSRFVRKSSRELKVQVSFRNDGTEAGINTVHYIRSELELDEDHGVDSKIFYEAEDEPDDFIQRYRTLLRKLAQF